MRYYSKEFQMQFFKIHLLEKKLYEYILNHRQPENAELIEVNMHTF